MQVQARLPSLQLNGECTCYRRFSRSASLLASSENLPVSPVALKFRKGKQLIYNYFRDYDPSIGRYVESDPIGLRAGLSTYSYVRSRPSQFADPSGLISWKGSVNSYGFGPYSRDDYTLESECKCGHKAKVKVQAQAFAVGKGGTWASSNAEFEDSLSCPEPYVFAGPYFKVSAGISGGYGTTFSFLIMGGQDRQEGGVHSKGSI